MRRYCTMNVASPRSESPNEDEEVLCVYFGDNGIKFELLTYMDGEYQEYDHELGWVVESKPTLWFSLPDVKTVERMLERIEGV